MAKVGKAHKGERVQQVYIEQSGGDNNTITNVSANITTHGISFDIVVAAPGTFDNLA